MVDARIDGESNDYLLSSVVMQMRETFAAMLDRRITLGSLRYRIHSGYAPPDARRWSGHYWGIMTGAPQSLGEDSEKTVKTPPTVIIVDVTPGQFRRWAALLATLQGAGR